MKVIDKILLIIGIALAIFSITMIILFCIYQTIPDTLCLCFFGAFTGETGCCTYIWKTKKKLKEKELNLSSDDEII